MTYNSKFLEVKNQHLPTLSQYVPIVARVHGPTHNEFYQVQTIFDSLVDALNSNESLVSQFEQLREVTEDYKVPEDVCESYEAVYQMLSELDNSYNN